jgi:hypothetical protein
MRESAVALTDCGHGAYRLLTHKLVTPAEAGTQPLFVIPAKAGTQPASENSSSEFVIPSKMGDGPLISRSVLRFVASDNRATSTA